MLRHAVAKKLITFLLSLSGLKVPNHDCICMEKSQNGKEEVRAVRLSKNNNGIMM